jgi:hypothetical protein
MNTNNGYAGSWGAHEEHRRTWYGVIALDRFAIHLFTKMMLIMLIFPHSFSKIGTCGLFACDDMGPHDLLPVDDIYWEKGVAKPSNHAEHKSAKIR